MNGAAEVRVWVPNSGADIAEHIEEVVESLQNVRESVEDRDSVALAVAEEDLVSNSPPR